MSYYLYIRSKAVCLLLFIATGYFNAAPAQNTIAVSYLGRENGLSNNGVTSIYQDHRGFMWFGTFDGLNRYDGYNFKIFRNHLNDPHSLVNNRISSIVEDSDHTMWVGTRSGVSKYDANTGSFLTVSYIAYQSRQPRIIRSTVNQINTTAAGDLFIATATEGLLWKKKGSPHFIQLPLGQKQGYSTQYEVSALEAGKGKNLWVHIGGKGLFSFDMEKAVFLLRNRIVQKVYSMRADNSGHLWIGGDHGLYRYDISTGTTHHITQNLFRFSHLEIDRQQRLWIASDGDGIFIKDPGSETVKPLSFPRNQSSLNSKAVYSICEDKEGRIWIGTLRGGVNVIDPNRSKFHLITQNAGKPSTQVNYITSFCEDGENLWIGTEGAGVRYWNRKADTFTDYPYQAPAMSGYTGNSVTNILKDEEDMVWTATWGGGIQRHHPKSGSFQLFRCYNTVSGRYNDAVWKLYQDSKKTLWASTCADGSLFRLNKAAKRFDLFDARLTNIISLAEDSSGHLWAGDFTSLIRIDQAAGKHLKYEVGFPVRAIHEDSRGDLWIGTEGGGLLLFDPLTGRYTAYTEKEGLCNNSILNVIEDKNGNLWISTFNGLAKFNTGNKKFESFSQSDGLQSNQFNYNAAIALQSGELVFGGIKGFNLFYPDSIKYQVRPSNVFITTLKIDNVPVEADSSYIVKRLSEQVPEISVPFDKAVLSVDFVALEYSAPDKINYAYYLEGWDKGWNYTGKNRTANYTHLQEGKYILRIKSTDTDGRWINQEYNMLINVMPPWFRSWWAYTLYILTFISIIYLYLQYRTQRARQAYQVALAKMETEKEKELNEKKLSFFTNISHEFRTPLTLIINPVKDLLQHPETAPDPGELNVIYRNARRLLSLVDQLLLFRKAESEVSRLKITRLNIFELCQEVYACFSQTARVRDIRYSFSSNKPGLELYADREKMEMILFNLLSNALKFTPDGGTVSVELTEMENDILFIVSDTGCGIDGVAGDQIFTQFYQQKNERTNDKKGFGIGLYLVKQFVESHKGTITYESEMNKGTRFTVRLHKDKAHLSEYYIHEEIGQKPALLRELMKEMEPDTLPTQDTVMVEKQPVSEVISEKKSILLVDDSPEILHYLNQIFAGRYIIYEAAGGEAALKLATSIIPDMIISDVVMEGITGVELCGKLKEDPELNHIPVILLTASSSAEIKLKGIECGAEDYITKPFDKELLLARVENIMKNRNTLKKYFFDTITLRKNDLHISAAYKEFLDKCIEIVEKNIDNEDFTVLLLAKSIGMSHSNLYKKVKSISGLSVNAFIRFIRLRKAAEILLGTDANVNETAFQVGLSDVKNFREQFAKLFGMSPSEYVRKYKSSFNKDFKVIYKTE